MMLCKARGSGKTAWKKQSQFIPIVKPRTFLAQNLLEKSIRATSWQNQQNDLCAQQTLRSAWASAQSD